MSNHAIFQKLDAPFDRFREAHFWIHTMEEYYHEADPFRWHLNAFLKALKEVPQLLEISLQNEPGFTAWFRDHKVRLRQDPLIAALSKGRDLIVHRGMLVPNSPGFLGVTEGRGLKMGFSLPLHALEDSDAAMERYLRLAKTDKDFLGILRDDEDSLPCVQREWRLEGIDGADDGADIVDICARAWLRLGETIVDILKWSGADVPALSLDCRHGSENVRLKLYDRDDLRKRMADIGTEPPGGHD
jgi:hypothetical protein